MIGLRNLICVVMGVVAGASSLYAGAARAESADEGIEGLRLWRCRGHLQADGKHGERMQTAYFRMKNDSVVLIHGFPCEGKLTEMLLSPDCRTVTVSNAQPVGKNGTGGSMMYLYTYHGTIDSAGKLQFIPQRSVQGTVGDDGTVIFADSVYFAASNPSLEPNGSYYYLDNENTFTIQPYNTPDEVDYEHVGTATFSDGWFTPLFDVEDILPVTETDVEVLMHRDNHALLALKNPYRDPRWEEDLGCVLTDTGYILLDISDPTWVQVVPLVPCNMQRAGGDGVLAEYYLWNEEGRHSWLGHDCAAIRHEWERNGENVSNMNGEGVISLYHLYFGLDYEPLAPYWWYKPAYSGRVATIHLSPEVLGIDGTDSDGAESPVTYYNLQGQPIPAPVPGQPAIRRHGLHISKVIMF